LRKRPPGAGAGRIVAESRVAVHAGTPRGNAPFALRFSFTRDDVKAAGKARAKEFAMHKVTVGIIGLGTVGGGVARILRRSRKRFRTLENLDIALAGASDLRKEAFRGLGIPGRRQTRRWREITAGDGIDIVCELIGGCTTAYEVIREALAAGKHVVTANKALLAERGEELFALAREKHVLLRFEAAVAGGVPILRSVREGLCANQITSVAGILNGTSNYILYAMAHEGIGFQQALAQAQEKGFAEADPTLDIDGHDAAHKLALLGSLAFRSWIPLHKITTEGISSVGLGDVTYAAELGYVIKPLAIGRLADGMVEVRVHPTLIPREDVLASVPREYNAVLVHGDAVGPTLYFGKGAGRNPTASSVVSDIADIARDIARGSVDRLDPLPLGTSIPVRPMADVETRYYLRLTARDVPGVIGGIGTTLARHDISIASVVQKEPVAEEDKRAPGVVPLVILLHETRERQIRAALRDLKRLTVVRSKPQVLRIEGRGE
jgi:homoserine dehydrogenase